jgi:hypothetical protein
MSLGKFQFTAKTWVIVIIVAALIVCGIGYALSQQPSTKTKIKESETITVTIDSNIGIDRVTITNLNTGQTIIKTIIDLPYKFNCTRGDYIRTSETVQEGFQWNAWEFSPMGRFDQHNPLTFEADGDICINNQITMTPKCIILEISPTATPIPTATPEPTPSPTPPFSPASLTYTQLIVVK